MSKTVMDAQFARINILAGVDFLANVVRVTEGPRGRNVILGQRALGQSPKVTRDGVTVSNYVDPADPTMQMGADLIREAAQKTDNAVGDGTTASIVLAQAMIHKGFALIEGYDEAVPSDFGSLDHPCPVQVVKKFANPMAMERGIHKATDAVIAQLHKMAVEATPERVRQVATVSAHGETAIGTLVADAVLKAGRDGVVTAEPSSTSETTVSTVAGLELEKSSLIHPSFITHPEEMKAVLLDARILLWEGVIATAKSLVPILNQTMLADPQVPLLIVAGGFEAEALAVIINNRIKYRWPIIAVRMEHYGDRRREVMRDIAALTGGTAYTEDMGVNLEKVTVGTLGSARKIITDMSKTQIIEGRGNQEVLLGRVTNIRQSMEDAAPAEKSILKRRLAALTGGITVIKVGGVTVTEMEEKRDRVVDAMSAAKAALDGGVVAGGGTALLRARVAISAIKSHVPAEEVPGLEVVYAACGAIAKQIADNAGLNGQEILDKLLASDLGFDAMTGKFYDLLVAGIVDPVNVVAESLKNASAVSCSILTMGATVAENFTSEKSGAV